MHWQAHRSGLVPTQTSLHIASPHLSQIHHIKQSEEVVMVKILVKIAVGKVKHAAQSRRYYFSMEFTLILFHLCNFVCSLWIPSNANDQQVRSYRHLCFLECSSLCRYPTCSTRWWLVGGGLWTGPSYHVYVKTTTFQWCLRCNQWASHVPCFLYYIYISPHIWHKKI